jgi:hypothetical protein
MLRFLGLITAVMAAATTSAHAESVPDKLCIFAAAQKLPAIPGLTIIASRLKPLPPDLQQKQTVNTAGMVEIDVKAAGQDATFTFICTANDKLTFAMPVGVAR